MPTAFSFSLGYECMRFSQKKELVLCSPFPTSFHVRVFCHRCIPEQYSTSLHCLYPWMRGSTPHAVWPSRGAAAFSFPTVPCFLRLCMSVVLRKTLDAEAMGQRPAISLLFFAFVFFLCLTILCCSVLPLVFPVLFSASVPVSFRVDPWEVR